MTRFRIAVLLGVLAVSCAISHFSQGPGASTTSISPRAQRVFCKVISTSPLALSGTQTVDGVAVGVGDVACPVGQSDNLNGAYQVQSGAWKALNPGIGTGVELYAMSGSTNANAVYGADTTGVITWGTTPVTFTKKLSTGASSTFSATVPGPIGTGTPDIVRAKPLQLAGTGLFVPVAGVTELSGTGTALNVRDGSGNFEIFLLPAAYGTNSGTAVVDHVTRAISLANNATIDIPVSGAGIMRIIATGGGTAFAILGFANDGSPISGGLTFTNFSTVLGTSSSLNVAKGTGPTVRVENKLGGTAIVLFSADYAHAT
jgi:hypothetical protein